jgi:endonuclease G
VNVRATSYKNYDEGLDFAIIGVQSKDVTGRTDISEMGYLVMNGEKGKIGKSDFASIIQHADGKLKTIALHKNEVTDIDKPDSIEYMTDTSVGSSGSPVFNDQWQVIALHSAGVPKKNANGDYLDKDDHIIVPQNGKIDGSRVVWLSNRRIRISSIMANLKTNQAIANHPLILQLAASTYSDVRRLDFLSLPTALPGTEKMNGIDLTESKVSNAEPQNVYNINISVGDKGAMISAPSLLAKGAAPIMIEMEKNSKKKWIFPDAAKLQYAGEASKFIVSNNVTVKGCSNTAQCGKFCYFC